VRFDETIYIRAAVQNASIKSGRKDSLDPQPARDPICELSIAYKQHIPSV
jgi:hypothetical protein